jgi:hypothetical protein
MRSRSTAILAQISIFALASLCIVGCSRKNNPSFGGTFNGKSTTDIAVKMPDGTIDKGDPGDNTADDDTYKISDLDGPEIDVTVLDEEDHCTLKATRSGATATIKPGQTCVTKDKDDAMTLNVTKGTVAIAGDQVTMDITFAAKIKSDGENINANMAIHFVGKRGA